VENFAGGAWLGSVHAIIAKHSASDAAKAQEATAQNLRML